LPVLLRDREIESLLYLNLDFCFKVLFKIVLSVFRAVAKRGVILPDPGIAKEEI
jgi:hypothetical protein